MPNHNQPGRPKGKGRSTKVFWNAAERAKLVSAAADIRADKPGLAGLPLIRQAMLTLPVDRRRDLSTLNRVAWFDEALRAEVRRRDQGTEAHPTAVKVVHSDEVLVSLLTAILDELAKHTHLLTRQPHGGGTPPTLSPPKPVGLSKPPSNGPSSAFRRMMEQFNGRDRCN
jgi:hypothetical protein